MDEPGPGDVARLGWQPWPGSLCDASRRAGLEHRHLRASGMTSLPLTPIKKKPRMLHLMFLLAGFAASQWIADEVKSALPAGKISSWCWVFLVQYVICLTLLVFFDHTPFLAAWSPTLFLIWLIRTIYMFKRL